MTMSPRDEATHTRITYTNVTVQAVSQPTVKLIAADPDRIAIIFSVNLAAGAFAVAPASAGGEPPTLSGLNISNQVPYNVLHKEFPGLTQAAWYGRVETGNTAAVCCIIEVAIKDWPQEDRFSQVADLARLLVALSQRVGQ